MSSYEVVERGAAAGHRHHGQPQPVDRQRLQGQGADRRGRRPGDPHVIEAQIARNGGTAIERRPFADAEAAGLVERFDPFAGLRDASSAGRSISTPSRPPTSTVLVDPMYGAGAGWIPRLLRRRQDPGHRDPPGAQPVLRRHQPRADPAAHRRGARDPRRGAATTSACCSTATRTGPARPTRRARSSTSSRSPAC